MMFSHPPPIYTSNMLYPPNLLPPGAAIYGPPTLPRDAVSTFTYIKDQASMNASDVYVVCHLFA